MFIFRLVERTCDCVGMPAYEIVDGYVAVVAEKYMFFDVSAESISADVAWVDVPARPTKIVIVLEEMTGQTSPTSRAFAIICTQIRRVKTFSPNLK